MKIVLIAYAYPPTPVVGAFRAAKVAEAFRREGHQVEVITARLPGESGALRLDEPGLRVHTVPCIPHPRHLYVWAKTRLRGGSPTSDTPTAEAAPAGAPIRRRPPRWKRLLVSMMRIPDDLQGFIAPALLRALPLIRDGAELLYTTAPPFSDHLAGLLLKSITGVRWAAEFRDPWTENPEAPSEWRSRPAHAAHRWLERRCLARADRIVAVAGATHELLAAKVHPRQRGKVILALNGIDRLEPGERPGTGGPFRIVYTGSFSAGRDPRTFLQALASLRARLALTPADLQVEIIGHARSYHGMSVEGYARDLGVADLISFADWMPQDVCRGHLREADLLLLLFRDQRIQIPNKLFDYLGAWRPILALVDPDGEAARMLRRAGGHHLVTENTSAAMEKALETAFTERGDAARGEIDEDQLREWTAERQMNRLMEALGVRDGSSRALSEDARSRSGEPHRSRLDTEPVPKRG